VAGCERAVVKRSADGRSFYFVHEAGNGQVFSTSEMYATEANAQRAAHKAHPDLDVVAQVEPPAEQP
jgi:uncharacterized protein YegP (UPF0339 family)